MLFILIKSLSLRHTLDIEYISGAIGNPDDTQVEINQHTPPAVDQRPQKHPFANFGPIMSGPSSGGNSDFGDVSTIFHQTFGDLFGHNNGFGSVGFGTQGFGGIFPGFDGPQFVPWWKG